MPWAAWACAEPATIPYNAVIVTGAQAVESSSRPPPRTGDLFGPPTHFLELPIDWLPRSGRVAKGPT